jgi:hypothetical protein
MHTTSKSELRRRPSVHAVSITIGIRRATVTIVEQVERMAMEGLANGWRQVLREEPEHARPILSTLLVGRVTFTPTARRAWKLEGKGTLCGLFQDKLSVGGSSPTGLAMMIGGPARRKAA